MTNKKVENITALAANVDKVITLMKALTLKRLIYFSVFLLVTIGGYTVFENRQSIYKDTVGKFDAPERRESMELSEDTKHAIVEFTKQRPYVEFVQVIDMDLYRNIRTAVFWFSNKPNTQAMLDAGPFGGTEKRHTGISMPLFVMGEELQNGQMISLINMQFSCNPSSPGSVVQLYPALLDTLKTTCRVPIPPQGRERINGYLAIHTNRELTKFEMDQLKINAYQLAMQIFLVDISKN